MYDAARCPAEWDRRTEHTQPRETGPTTVRPCRRAAALLACLLACLPAVLLPLLLLPPIQPAQWAAAGSDCTETPHVQRRTP